MRGRGGSRRLRGAAGGRETARSGAAAAVGASAVGKRAQRIGEQHQQQASARGDGLSGAAGRNAKRIFSVQVGSGRGKQQRRNMSASVGASLGADDEEIPSDDEEVLGAADSDSDTPHRKPRSDTHADNEKDVEEGGEDEQRLRMARAFLQELAARRSVHRKAAAEKEGEESDAASGEGDGEGEEEEEEEAGEGDASLASLLRRQADARTPHAFRETPASLGLRFNVFLRGHKLPVTCVAAPGMGDASEQQRQQEFVTAASSTAPSLDRHIYTGGKDCCVLRWDLQEEKKVVFQGRRNDFHCGGHFRPVLGLCVAPDESFFCSVGADQLLRIWDYRTSTTKCVAALRGHNGAICSVKLNNWPSAGAGGGTGSSFYAGTQTFSSAGDIEVITCGADKSIKLWNLALRACLNSYFGHTAPVNAMDVMLPNRPLTVGEDCTARSWKLVQDTHLVFSPQLTSVDACCYLTPSLFACGTQGGVVSLYSTLQKKPIAAVQQREPSSRTPKAGADSSSRRGITAMAALRRSEVFFTGSEGGAVQMWRAKKTKRKERAAFTKELYSKQKSHAGSGCEVLEDGDSCAGGANSASLQLASYGHVNGVVTSLCLTPSEHTLVAAVSKESRLGRWTVDKEARNGIALFSVSHEEEDTHPGVGAEEDAYTD